MEDRFRILKVTDVVDEVICVDVIRELQRRKILPLVGLIHPIDDQDVVAAHLIQPPNDRTPDKPRPTGNNDLFTSRHQVNDTTTAWLVHAVASGQLDPNRC